MTIHWKVANLVKTYHGVTELRHPIDLRGMALLKERDAAEKKRHLQCCSDPAWMKNGWQILWSACAICEMFNTSWQMVKL